MRAGFFFSPDHLRVHDEGGRLTILLSATANHEPREQKPIIEQKIAKETKDCCSFPALLAAFASVQILGLGVEC
jgi:hypothetical protein